MRLDKGRKRRLKAISAVLIAILAALQFLPTPLAQRGTSNFYKGFLFEKFTGTARSSGFELPEGPLTAFREALDREEGTLSLSKQANSRVSKSGHPNVIVFRTLVKGGGYDRPAIGVGAASVAGFNSIRPSRQASSSVSAGSGTSTGSQSSPDPQPVNPPPSDPPPGDLPPAEPPPADPPAADPPPGETPVEPSQDPPDSGRGDSDDDDDRNGSSEKKDDEKKSEGKGSKEHGKGDEPGKGKGGGDDDGGDDNDDGD